MSVVVVVVVAVAAVAAVVLVAGVVVVLPLPYLSWYHERASISWIARVYTWEHRMRICKFAVAICACFAPELT